MEQDDVMVEQQYIPEKKNAADAGAGADDDDDDADAPRPQQQVVNMTMDNAFDWQEFSDWATTTTNSSSNDSNGTIRQPDDHSTENNAVQTFLSGGNRNDTATSRHHAQLVHEITKRRKSYWERIHQGLVGAIIPHEETSFEIMDTPIWHYRNNSNNNAIAAPATTSSAGRTGLLRRRNNNHKQQQQQATGSDDKEAGFTCVAAAAAAEPQQLNPPPPPPQPEATTTDDDDEKSRRRRRRQRQETERRLTRIVSRLVVVAIGLVMSMVGFVISYSAEKLINIKIDYSLQYHQAAAAAEADAISQELDDKGNDNAYTTAASGFGIFIASNVVLALLAFVPVVFRPHSAGSGIAEAKAVLNGLVIDTCTDLSTAFCKGISVIFAASASLPIGLEGPLIFIGLSIGEHASGRCISRRRFPSLRTDRARRDFCAVGTAAGVSAAFYAPIGGVLFALEEGASYWSQVLMWRCFAAACVTLFVTYFWIACVTRDFGTTIDFANIAKFSGLDKHENTSYPFVFYLRDFFVFIILGAVGGCAGALFNWLNKNLTVWRRAHIRSIPLKGLEVVLLTSVMSSLQWWLPIVYKQCGKIQDLPEMDIDAAFVYRQFNCKDGEYNHLSTLFLNNLSTAINMLFHAPPTAFTAVSCVISGTVYYVMLICLFGSSIGMGIFIPLLYIGGAFGRAIGLALTENWYPEGTTSSLVHTYSVVMATAMLGGVTQVLISLSVIMLQATALSYFVVPFMLATIFARVVARMFGARGIYDQILHLKGLPFLEEMPSEFIVTNSSLRARDIMSQPEVTLHPEMKISALMDILRGVGGASYEYQVMSPLHDEALIGTIQKSHVLYLLQHQELFYTLNECDAHTSATDNSRPRKALKYDVLLKDDPHLPCLDEIERDLHSDDLNKFVDLSPYVQIAPHAVDGHCSAERAYELFRMIGLRNLLVLGANYKPIGVIKRSDLFILEDCGNEHDIGTKRHGSVAQDILVS